MAELYIPETKEEITPLFINRSEMNEQGVAEAMKSFMRTPSWILIRALFLVMAGVGVFIVLRGMSQGTEPPQLLMGAAVVLLSIGLYIHRFVIYPASNAKKVMKKKREKYKTDSITLEYRFFDDKLTSLTAETDTSEIPYDGVARIFETNHYIVISTYRRQMLLLSPSGFENGSVNDFRTLMQKKCLRALPKKRRNT